MTHSKAVVLARVSSKAQEDEGYSLDAQLKLIRSYCRDAKLNVVSEFRISETASKNDKRIEFKKMVAYINKHDISNVVVEKTDRLTRNFKDAIIMDDWLDANEMRRLHMIKEGLIIHKYARSDEKMMWNIYLAIAKKHTDNLREEAMKGWSEKLSQGWMPSGPTHGYKTAIEDGKRIHVIDQERAFLVERAFNFYLEPGQTIDSVCREVVSIGLCSRKGRALTKRATYKMLRNKFYIGIIHFSGKDYPGAHEPLLANELFEAVQNKLSGVTRPIYRKHDQLYRGLLKCSSCNKTITWQLQKGRFYGNCQRKIDECKGHGSIRQDRLDEEVFYQIEAIDKNDKESIILNKLKKKLQISKEPYVGQHRVRLVKLVNQRIRRSEQMKDNLYDDKLTGFISDQKFEQKIKEINDEMTNLQTRLYNLEKIESQVNSNSESSNTICSLYENELKPGKRIILNELFDITVHKGKVVFKLR